MKITISIKDVDIIIELEPEEKGNISWDNEIGEVYSVDPNISYKYKIETKKREKGK